MTEVIAFLTMKKVLQQFRLPQEMVEKTERFARITRTNKTEIVIAALEVYLDDAEMADRLEQRAAELRASSGLGDSAQGTAEDLVRVAKKQAREIVAAQTKKRAGAKQLSARLAASVRQEHVEARP